MVQTYSDNNNIYSVDMMLAYLGIYKHPISQISTKDYHKSLEYKGWGSPINAIYYSPKDVLANKEDYPDELQRIEKADLSYPIIIHNGYIVDGVHRLTKAFLNGIEEIKAYIFEDELMEKFLVNNEGNWTKVNEIDTHYFIKEFFVRFRNHTNKVL